MVKKSWRAYRVFHKGGSESPIKFVYASNRKQAKKKAGPYDWRKTGLRPVLGKGWKHPLKKRRR